MLPVNGADVRTGDKLLMRLYNEGDACWSVAVNVDVSSDVGRYVIDYRGTVLAHAEQVLDTLSLADMRIDRWLLDNDELAEAQAIAALCRSQKHWARTCEAWVRSKGFEA